MVAGVRLTRCARDGAAYTGQASRLNIEHVAFQVF